MQWPFLHDTSLLAAIMAVFLPRARAAARRRTRPRRGGRRGRGRLDVTLLQPWLYFNVLVTDSQLCVPVLDKVRWRGACGLLSEDLCSTFLRADKSP